MESFGAYEAKTHLHQLLDRVARGESIAIPRRGVPVSMLVPVQPAKAPDPEAVIAEFRRLRKGRKLKGVKIADLIREGRRY